MWPQGQVGRHASAEDILGHVWLLHEAREGLQLGRFYMVASSTSSHFARLSRLEVGSELGLAASDATDASGARVEASGSWQSACAQHDPRAAAELRSMARSANIWKERAPEGIGRLVRLLCRSGANFSRLLELLAARRFRFCR